MFSDLGIFQRVNYARLLPGQKEMLNVCCRVVPTITPTTIANASFAKSINKLPDSEFVTQKNQLRPLCQS